MIESRLLFSPRRVRFVALLGLAVALLGGVTGCSNNPYPPGQSAQSVRYVAWGSDLRSMDPTIAYNAAEGAVIDNIYECYFRYHHLKEKPYVVETALGAMEPTREKVTLTVADPKTGRPTQTKGEQWTFRIKRGLRFQDDPCFPGGHGREITAADFVYSWRRMADPSLNCPILSFVQDKVLGFNALVKHNADLAKAKQPADYAYPLPGVAVDPHDPYTFRIRLIQPYPQLRYLMAMHFTTPIPHEAIEYYGPDFARHPVGCGTFMMAEYRPKQRIVLVKNPNRMYETYPTSGDPGDREAGFLQDAGRQLPLLDKIVFVWCKEGVTSWNLFQQGYLDSVGVTQDNYNQVLQGPGRLTPEMVSRGIKLQKSSEPFTTYYAFNMKDPVWGGYTDRGRKLRQAISLCFDREQYIAVMNQGLGKPAQSMLPPGLFGYDPNYHNPYSRTDVSQAKALLAAAGYPGGIDPHTHQRLSLTYDVAENGSAGIQSARMVKQWIEASGVQVNIQTWQSVQWEERVLGGKSQFFSYGWIADYPDPENFLQLLYGPNSGINYAQYDNPAYNKLYEQMRAMDDSPARLAIIRKMRAILQNDCPWIFFYHAEGIAISYPWLRNNKPHGIAGDAVRYTAVDGAQRAAFQERVNQPRYLPVIVVLVLLGLALIPAARIVSARRNRSVRRHPSPPTAADAEREVHV